MPWGITRYRNTTEERKFERQQAYLKPESRGNRIRDLKVESEEGTLIKSGRGTMISCHIVLPNQCVCWVVSTQGPGVYLVLWWELWRCTSCFCNFCYDWFCSAKSTGNVFFCFLLTLSSHCLYLLICFLASVLHFSCAVGHSAQCLAHDRGEPRWIEVFCTEGAPIILVPRNPLPDNAGTLSFLRVS